jgi:hypothetical protein
VAAGASGCGLKKLRKLRPEQREEEEEEEEEVRRGTGRWREQLWPDSDPPPTLLSLADYELYY